MKKITVWQRIKTVKQEDDTEIETISHNHIEDNWVDGTKPQPLKAEFEQQKSWVNYKWVKTFAHIDKNNKII